MTTKRVDKTAGQSIWQSRNLEQLVSPYVLSSEQLKTEHMGSTRRSPAELAAWAKRAGRPLYIIERWDEEDRTCTACNLIFDCWGELVYHPCDHVHRPRPVKASQHITFVENYYG